MRSQGTLYNLTSGQRQPDPENDGNLIFFFQHHSGEIRWMQRVWPDSWRGGSVGEVVAVDAKNGTPISTLAMNPAGVQYTHVFCKPCRRNASTLHANALADINKNDIVSERVFDNSTGVWADGLLNNRKMRVPDAKRLGLQACGYSGPIQDSTNNLDSNGTEKSTGMRIWVASSTTRFEELSWRFGLAEWIWDQSWPDLNGYASPACFDWGKGSVTYVMFVDMQHTVSLYWFGDTKSYRNVSLPANTPFDSRRDTAADLLTTETHPINTWRKCECGTLFFSYPQPPVSVFILRQRAD